MKPNEKKSVFYAITAAFLYAFSSPFSKIFLKHVSPTMMAAFLYLGAGTGIFLMNILTKKSPYEKPLTKKEFPYALGMILLDIAAPIFLMIGLSKTSAANVSLLNNFEIVSTSIIALFIFREKISKKLWTAIILVTVSTMLLSFENSESLSFSFGSLFVILACISWGFENNFTRKMSQKNPMHIVILKGLFSGLGSFIIAISVKEQIPHLKYILGVMLLGFIAYGLSIFFYVYAQRTLGAAKTSTYYAVAPFIGSFLSLIIFRELPSATFIIALIIMIIGTYFAGENSK